MSNFDFIATYVDLSDSSTYTTNITLEGQLLKISFVWNERIGKRTIFIRNSADVCYLQNTILHPNESFELNSNAVFDDLPYKVVLQKVGDTNKVGNIYNWSKDFILCFYRTVDIETEKLNVKYGVTAPSTPSLPKGFGNWILNQGYELVNEDIKYMAYKTNGVSYYDSFANFDLVTALVRSFHDSDMQQWQAVIDACNELTGVTDWVFDATNEHILYNDPNIDSINYYKSTSTATTIYNSAKDACTSAEVMNRLSYSNGSGGIFTNYIKPVCYYTQMFYGSNRVINLQVYQGLRTAPLDISSTISFTQIAQKIISNTSSSNQAISILAEAYIQEVCNSLFNTDTSKQFVKLEDLIPQLEVNKLLR